MKWATSWLFYSNIRTCRKHCYKPRNGIDQSNMSALERCIPMYYANNYYKLIDHFCIVFFPLTYCVTAWPQRLSSSSDTEPLTGLEMSTFSRGRPLNPRTNVTVYKMHSSLLYWISKPIAALSYWAFAMRNSTATPTKTNIKDNIVVI